MAFTDPQAFSGFCWVNDKLIVLAEAANEKRKITLKLISKVVHRLFFISILLLLLGKFRVKEDNAHIKSVIIILPSGM